jgi:outer membrane protein TolC
VSKHSTFAKLGFLAVALLAAGTTAADPAPAVAPVPVEEALASLVAEAEQANLELAGSEANVAARLAVLDQARARFLPALDLSARYSRADGGRDIEIPVGDLVNPIYATLNALLEANGQPGTFTAIPNQSIPFLREREQETKLTLVQPLYDARIPAAARAAGADYDAARQGFAALRARVRRDVQQAYLRWMSAAETRLVLDAALETAAENQRVNESLYRNGKVTRDSVLRAEADRLEIEQQRIAVDGAERLALRYVNLLRNAPLDAPLPAARVADADVSRLRERMAAAAGAAATDLEALQAGAVERRPELRQIDSGLDATAAAEDLARAAFKPQLAFAVDAGVQGEEFSFGEDERFVLASLVLRFNLFRGGADRAALREARSRRDELRASRALAEQQIRLEVLAALEDFRVAEASLATAAKQVEASEGAYAIVRRKRDLGQVPQVEFIDARRELTRARINRNISRFDALSALAALEYAVGADLLESTP